MKLLKKAQHERNEFKTKYKQSIISLKRIQLDSDRFSTNIELLKAKNQTLEEENKILSEQYAYLEERYNKQVIESMKTIKDLQDELQMIQELKAEVPKPKKISSNTKVDNLREEKEALKAQISELINERIKLQEGIKDIQFKNEGYVKEVTNLKSQVFFIKYFYKSTQI